MRRAHALVFSLLLVGCSALSSHACENPFASIDEMAAGNGGGAAGGGDCPMIPQCPTSDPCAVENPNIPFRRIAPNPAVPVYDRGGCFGVDKRDDTFYLHYSRKVGENGFRRSVSTDGGFTWQLDSGPPALSMSGAWWNTFKCPDPEFLPNGDVLLFFRGNGPGGGIGRAVSTDDGVSFIADATPALPDPDSDHYFDNPSVLQRDGFMLMAYTWGCNEAAGTFQDTEIRLAISDDEGVSWTESPFNPALTCGPCDTWDHGSIANPVLMADPNDTDTLHMFYAGGWWTGTTTRGCYKYGHAISTNAGRTWCKTGVVLDKPAATSVAWDKNQYFTASCTIENGGAKIRMFYWASSSVFPEHMGVAQANWPLPGCGAAMEDTHSDIGMEAIPVANLHALVRGEAVYLSSHPNPSSGETILTHNLKNSGRHGPGSVSVYNVQGQRVFEIWSGLLKSAPESWPWNGATTDGTRLASGRYLLRLDGRDGVLATHWVTLL